MSPSTQTSTLAQTRPVFDLSDAPVIGFGRLVRVELRKLRDTRAGWWLLLGTGLLTVAVMTIQTIVGGVQDQDLTYHSFLESTTYSIALLLPILGILLVTGEWSQRTAVTTFALVPHRGRVLGAKYVAGVLIALAATAATLVLAVLCNVAYAGIAGGSAGWDLHAGQLLTFALFQLIGMGTGLALASLFLNTPAAVVGYFVYTFVLTGLFALGAATMDWFDRLRPWLDFGLAQVPLTGSHVSGSDWAHLAVTGLVWLVLPLAVGWVRMQRAEVK